MRTGYFPHMEWAKAHTDDPLPIELGFSGAARPRGAPWREHGRGEPETVARVAKKYGVQRDRVHLVGGTSLANFIAIAACCDPGETVAVETPRYAPLAQIPLSLGARVVDVKRSRAGRLGRIPRRAKLVVVSDPHNPTGRLLDKRDWARLSAAANRGAVVVVDEVYRDVQKKPGRVAARRHDRFVTTGSFTKGYGLGALRLGWIFAHPDLLAETRRVDNLVAVECATPSYLQLKRVWPRLERLRRRTMAPVRENVATLQSLGLDFVEPQAGLTAFVHVGDGDAVADELETQGVGVARGSFFEAPAYVRVFLGANPTLFRRGASALAALLA
ncbi:MAG: pyridoxal phosphate-dependent aminotransferase [Planctomycetota bacterium]|nr:pyridoxal phosphate-dependent aminotransferase [Planctomycetota bacterium]